MRPFLQRRKVGGLNPPAKKHGNRPIRILMLAARSLHVVQTVFVLGRLQAKAVMFYRIVLADHPIFLYTKNVAYHRYLCSLNVMKSEGVSFANTQNFLL